jgi:hypothetical protein
MERTTLEIYTHLKDSIKMTARKNRMHSELSYLAKD